MTAGDAAVLFLVAGTLAVVGGLVYRGHTGLVAGHRPGVDDAAFGRWFGVRMLALAAVTAGLAGLELRGAATDAAWLAYVAAVCGVCAWLAVGSRRFRPDSP